MIDKDPNGMTSDDAHLLVERLGPPGNHAEISDIIARLIDGSLDPGVLEEEVAAGKGVIAGLVYPDYWFDN